MRARDNPFSTDRVERERYRLDEAGWDALIGAIERAGWRGAIVGPHGSGKTTLLEDLGARLSARGCVVRMVRLHSWSRALPAESWGPGDVVLCDGVEQLSVMDAMRLRWRARRARGLIVTTHGDGWHPVLFRCATEPALLRGLVASLGASLSDDEAEALHHRHRGNVRDALRELYDRVP